MVSSPVYVNLLGEFMLKQVFQKSLIALATVATAGVGFAKPAAAASFTTFTDLASWEAAVGGSYTLETFDGVSTSMSRGAQTFSGLNGFSVTTAGVGGSQRTGVENNSRTNFNGTNSLSARGGSSSRRGVAPGFEFNFGGPINAFGFNWRDNDPTDEQELCIGSVCFSGPPSSSRRGRGFFGVVADPGMEFTEVVYRNRIAGQGGALSRGFGIDNVRTASSQPVPEPASLLGLAVIGAVAAGGALKKKTAA